MEIIDDDLGRSGAAAERRSGFQRLAAQVSLGRCGAVFSLEASRLACNNADWYRLLDLCALTGALILDGESAYDPRLPEDRLILGLKGALSEAELAVMRQRLQAGAVSKARRGELYTTVAVGYLRTEDDRLEKDPDQRVQESIQGVFAAFARTGSARQALLWHRQEGIRLPARRHDGREWRTVWRLPVCQTILSMLRNPVYAGAYAWGRTRVEAGIGQPGRRVCRERAREEWIVLIRDKHEGCIDWRTWERNQAVLEDNAQMEGRMTRGAPRSGRSLLAGLLSCGHCGRRLHVAYSGKGGKVPRYHCRGAQINHGSGPCISFGGLKVDEAVEKELLRAVQPAAVEAAVQAAGQIRKEAERKSRLLERELEQLRYEADRAFRQYDAVDPDNRLVAASLESKWNQALARASEAERRLRDEEERSRCGKRPDREALTDLAERFEQAWGSRGEDMRLKKPIARILIEEIIARVEEEEGRTSLMIRWRGGKHTRLGVRRNKSGRHRYGTDRSVVELVGQLAEQSPDHEIAAILNRLGLKTGRGSAWTRSRVNSLRNRCGIPVFRPEQASAEYCNQKQAAEILNISPSSVRRLIRERILPASQVVALAPWRIRREGLGADAVQRAARAIRERRPLRTRPGQRSFLESTK